MEHPSKDPAASAESRRLTAAYPVPRTGLTASKIWYTHKHFCGESASPFRFPLFTEDEEAFAVRLEETPVSVPDGTLRPRVAVERLLGTCHFPSVIESISQTATNPFPPSPVRDALISRVSGLVAQHRCSTRPSLARGAPLSTLSAEALEMYIAHCEPKMMTCAFGGAFLEVTQELSGDVTQAYPTSEPWYVEMLHLASVYSAVWQRSERARSAKTPDYRTVMSHIGFMKQLAVRMRALARTRKGRDAAAMGVAIDWLCSHREVNGAWEK